MTPTDLAPQGAHRGLAEAVFDLVAAIPSSDEPTSDAPLARADALAAAAARKAAGISGGAALVPGPLGLLSLLPDILGVWRVQAQMVADIAAAFGQSATLTTETMLYCLFRHLLSQGLRDVVVRAGERYLVRAASLQLLQRLAALVGVKTSQRALTRTIARFAPLVGAFGVGLYAFYDTRQVAKTAVELFTREVVIEAA